MEYWAHSEPPQLLNVHLRKVADLAEAFAKQAAPGDSAFHLAARAAGLLHDLGKYTPEFQRKIRGEAIKAPHSAHGAALTRKCKALEAAFAIAGHHGGLPNPKGGQAGLWERTMAVDAALEILWQTAVQDCPGLSEFRDSIPATTATAANFDLRTRMLFSCLVDADRIDSSGKYQIGEPLDPSVRLERLLDFISRRASEVPEGTVKRARMAVLEACLAAAGRAGSIFSLTVPTGGAKTLASMAFALRRATLFPHIRRVIVVIPFLSIIEQNAQVFADALGPDAILEHHSGDVGTEDNEVDYESPARRPATENWDAPIVITTSVRFFESLFTNQPSGLRRIHNIAGSVVIMDECQTIPRKFIQPILSVIGDLTLNWNTTFLFCTATQPAFEKSKPDDPRWVPGTVQEIMPQPRELFTLLKRVNVEWPKSASTWKEIAEGLVSARRALCIINTKRHALALYREVSASTTIDGGSIFHLSTRMCPAHRLRTIAEIKRRLVDPTAACVVVSTQLVEAGVDLDFPVVYRAMGPLDSIAQAAGRCDREGRLTESLRRPAGRVIVFEPEKPRLPAGVYREATERTRALVRADGFSIDEPDCIRRYFDRLYSEANLGAEIEKLRIEARFRDLWQDEGFKMISDETRPVFVPYDEEARERISELNATGILHLKLLRQLQHFTIGLFEAEIRVSAQRGALYEVRPGSNLWICPEGLYDASLGFLAEPLANQMAV